MPKNYVLEVWDVAGNVLYSHPFSGCPVDLIGDDNVDQHVISVQGFLGVSIVFVNNPRNHPVGGPS
jgi:hypothetical protein